MYYATRSVGFSVSGAFRIWLKWWPANRKARYKRMMIKNGEGLETRSMSHFFSCKSQSLICGCSTASSLKSQFALEGTRIDSVCTWQTFNTEAHIAGTACWRIVSHLCPCLAHWDVCSAVSHSFSWRYWPMDCNSNIYYAYPSIINDQFWNGGRASESFLFLIFRHVFSKDLYLSRQSLFSYGCVLSADS